MAPLTNLHTIGPTELPTRRTPLPCQACPAITRRATVLRLEYSKCLSSIDIPVRSAHVWPSLHGQVLLSGTITRTLRTDPTPPCWSMRFLVMTRHLLRLMRTKNIV